MAQCSESRAPLWLVADMDETLLAKSNRDIRTSPTFEHLLRWLRPPGSEPAAADAGLGNKLLIVTSDEGFRPFRIWSQFPDEVKGIVCNVKVGSGAHFARKSMQPLGRSWGRKWPAVNCHVQYFPLV